MKRIFAEKMFQRVDSQFVPEVVFLYLIPYLPKSLYQPYLYTSKKSSFHRRHVIKRTKNVKKKAIFQEDWKTKEEISIKIPKKR